MSQLDTLKEELAELFLAELGGFFKQLAERERAFLTAKAGRIAEERLALEIATTPEEIAKHTALLEALLLTVENEMIQLGLDIAEKNRKLLVKILGVVVRVLIAGRQ